MKNTFLSFVTLLLSITLFSQNAKPVTPNASPEAVALLEFLYTISGDYMLTGQHNYPISKAKNSEFASNYIGETPVIWSQDFGFSEEGDKDSYLSRPSIVEEAIKQHKLGSIISLCWHAVPPTADEPITFQPLPGSDPLALASVQGKLSDQQFEDILTPGTDLYNKWILQVDEIAKYLKQLQDANIPVMWRPYHEMNGDWFWWGGIHEGEYTTERLYRQIFDRFVNHHKLTNLIWVWNVDRPSNMPERAFKKYYPGNEYLDVVTIDIYGSDYQQTYYDQLKELAKGKPLGLGEVGVPPSVEVLKEQPDWTFYIIWAGMVKRTSKEQYNNYLKDPHVLFLEDVAYTKLVSPLREVSKLPQLGLKGSADFSGLWVLNEQESEIQNAGPGGTPYKMNIIQVDELLATENFTQVEWDDDTISKQLIKGDGSDMESIIFNTPLIENATWSAGKDKLTITSTVTFNFGGNERTLKGEKVWTIEKNGKQLIINSVSDNFNGGKSTSRFVYDKQ